MHGKLEAGASRTALRRWTFATRSTFGEIGFDVTPAGFITMGYIIRSNAERQERVGCCKFYLECSLLDVRCSTTHLPLHPISPQPISKRRYPA